MSLFPVSEENQSRCNGIDQTDDEGQIGIKMENGLKVGGTDEHAEEKDAGKNQPYSNIELSHCKLLTRYSIHITARTISPPQLDKQASMTKLLYRLFPQYLMRYSTD